MSKALLKEFITRVLTEVSEQTSEHMIDMLSDGQTEAGGFFE